MANPQKEQGYTPIANELVEQMAKFNLSSYEWRTLFALWRKTWGWGKTSDRISITQFQKITGLDRRHQFRAIKSLIRRNIVAYSGNGKVKLYRFQKDYTLWKNVAYSGTSAYSGNRALPIQATLSLPIQAPTKEKNTIQKKETQNFSDDVRGRFIPKDEPGSVPDKPEYTPEDEELVQKSLKDLKKQLGMESKKKEKPKGFNNECTEIVRI